MDLKCSFFSDDFATFLRIFHPSVKNEEMGVFQVKLLVVCCTSTVCLSEKKTGFKSNTDWGDTYGFDVYEFRK